MTPRRALPALALAVCAVAGCGTGRSVDDLAPPARPGQPAGTVVVTARGTVVDTVARLRDAITANRGTVTAVVDHAADARAAHVDGPADTLVIGGSPGAQIPLLRVAQRAAANVPARYLVRQDGAGAVTVTANSADYVTAVSGVTNTAAAAALASEGAAVTARGADVATVPLAAPLVGVTPQNYLIETAGFTSVPATVARLRAAADRPPSKVVAVLDPAAGPAPPGPAVRPTTEVLVTTPEVEVPLIATAPSFGLEMPMRFVVWADEQNVTQVGYPDVRVVAARHGLPAADANVARLAADADRLAKLAATRG